MRGDARRKVKRQIVAHGSGFSLEDEHSRVDDYVLSLVKRKLPRVCFLPHTTDDAPGYRLKFHEAMALREVKASTLSLFTPPTADLAELLLEQDVIYVGGGNTKSLLALWREWRLDRILREAYRRGVVLCGISAGACCWFEQAFSDSVPGRYTVLKGLGLLKGSCNPHCDKGGDREAAYIRAIARDRIAPGVGIPDGVAAHYLDGKLHRVVTVDAEQTLGLYQRKSRRVTVHEVRADLLAEQTSVRQRNGTRARGR
ncbi:MAG TPA: peptidase E [Blastocatellia bacterium]|nr:peptidase E [Blastocatellia bacterium]